jgi:hypothetical protein
MATLQAARAARLGLPRNSAYSWGLNRAIFYAAAKMGFKRGGAPGEGARAPAAEGPAREEYHLGDDFAFRDTSKPGVYFTIGDETQTEKEFQRQIIDRFGSTKVWTEAWDEATKIVGEADLEDLKSGSRFYSEVYKPRRDALREHWTELTRDPGAS